MTIGTPLDSASSPAIPQAPPVGGAIGAPPPPAPPVGGALLAPSPAPPLVKVESGADIPSAPPLSGLGAQLANAKLKAVQKKKEEVKEIDTRSDLLSQIKRGRELKKVQQETDRKDKIKRRQSGFAGWMENAMDERRAYFESESDDDGSFSDGSCDWDD